jgi:hypothetical protein
MSLVAPALTEADAIWRAAELALELRNDSCSVSNAVQPVHVLIDDETKCSAPGEWVLGWIEFTASNVPVPRIVVSRATVERLLDRQCRVCARRGPRRHELIARALGRAVAHEIGHYLLRSRAHASRGLMRAAHPPAHFFDEWRRGFTVSAAEARAAAMQAERLNRALAP